MSKTKGLLLGGICGLALGAGLIGGLAQPNGNGGTGGGPVTPSRPCNGSFCSATSPLSGALGGTGVSNSGKTLILGASLATTGTSPGTFALPSSGAVVYSFPTTSATLARTDAGQTFTGANIFSNGTTFNSAITYGGVTLSNAVTGTGNMALSANPTFTGTISGAAGTFTSTLTTNITGGGTQCAQVSNTGVLSGSGSACGTATPQVLTSGTNATYTTPAGAHQLRIRMVGAGGGGASNATNAVDGTGGGTASFNGITAIGGAGGHNSGNPSAGGSGGNNTPTGGAVTGLFRMAGAWGGTGVNGTGSTSANGGNGASSVFGGGTGSGNSAPNNSGSGGGGGGIASALNYSGSGGAAGEYVEFIINAPVGTYLYTVPAGGNGGTGAGNGGSGVIIVEAF